MWLILQQKHPGNFVCASGISRSVEDLCSYTFQKLNLSYKDYVATSSRYMRKEGLENLKGDATKLKSIGWKADYTFEETIDEMINYWVKFYKNPIN